MKMPKLNFKVLFDNDKFLWFLSFLFAFMLWFTVVNTIDTTADRSITNVPVSFDSSSESLEAMGLDVVLDEPIMVKVDMSGERSVVANVDRQDLLVQADLTGVTSAGEYTVHLSVTDRLGRDFDNLSTTPKEVTVRFDRTVKKTLSVTVDLSRLTYPDGYVIGDDYVNVQSVTISGPESSINSMTELSVGYIDFRDLDSGEYNFNLNLPAGFINLEGDESITVSIDTTGIISRTMSVSEIRLENVPDGYTVTPVTTAIRDVTVYGRSDIMETLTEEDLVAVVDLSDMDLSEGTSSAIANLSAPGKGLVWCSGTYRVQFSVQSTD